MAVLLPIFLLAACTQDHLIYLKNIKTTRIITVEQILKEAGLPAPKGKKKIAKKTKSARETSYTTPKTTKPSKTKSTASHYTLNIPTGEQFSIRIKKKKSDFVVVQAIKGDVQYDQANSIPEDGYFVFKMGNKSSKAYFNRYNQNGKLVNSTTYNIIAKTSLTPKIKTTKTNIIVVEDDEQKPSTKIKDDSYADIIISSLDSLTTSEQINTLTKKLVSTSISPNDKELLRYKLIDILIDRRNYNGATTNIELIKNKYKQYYYNAHKHRKQRNYKNAVNDYLFALGGNNSIKKDVIREIEDVMLMGGNVNKKSLKRLETESKKFKKSDKEYYAKSIINIARLYQFIPDMYKSEELLKSIIDGDYRYETRQLAKKHYELLKDNFLEYK